MFYKHHIEMPRILGFFVAFFAATYRTTLELEAGSRNPTFRGGGHRVLIRRPADRH